MKNEDSLHPRLNELTDFLCTLKSVVVAFSGGVDSAFLLAAAKRALGDNAIAVIGKSPIHPQSEFDDAIRMAKQLNAKYHVIESTELTDPDFLANTPERCFFCKNSIMKAACQVAKENGQEFVVDGGNIDDDNDYRPGQKAAKALGVRSPLKELKFGKQEIRNLSRELGLFTWDKPAFACLVSRIPYGDEISPEKLKRIEQAELCVMQFGINQLRVRDHGNLARIEVTKEDISQLTDEKTRQSLVNGLKNIGYLYVCLDLQGYRMGSMNETLKTKE